MALRTFNPSVPPSPGTEDKPEINLLETEFGDGYTQVSPKGLNHIRRVLSLTWEYLQPQDSDDIMDFLKEHGGYMPFYYTPSDATTPLKWTCKEFSEKRLQGGIRSISATFRQSFDLRK